jgi:hypothetical protein
MQGRREKLVLGAIVIPGRSQYGEGRAGPKEVSDLKNEALVRALVDLLLDVERPGRVRISEEWHAHIEPVVKLLWHYSADSAERETPEADFRDHGMREYARLLNDLLQCISGSVVYVLDKWTAVELNNGYPRTRRTMGYWSGIGKRILRWECNGLTRSSEEGCSITKRPAQSESSVDSDVRFSEEAQSTSGSRATAYLRSSMESGHSAKTTQVKARHAINAFSSPCIAIRAKVSR